MEREEKRRRQGGKEEGKAEINKERRKAEGREEGDNGEREERRKGKGRRGKRKRRKKTVHQERLSKHFYIYFCLEVLNLAR